MCLWCHLQRGKGPACLLFKSFHFNHFNICKGEKEHAYFIRHFTQVLPLLILNSKAYIESYQESSLSKEITFKSIHPFIIV